MANKEAKTRLRPILHAYLVDIAKTGAYGRAKAGVMRHFIQVGIVQALEAGVISKRHALEFGENPDADDDDEDGDASPAAE
jgi:hypothetical protein